MPKPSTLIVSENCPNCGQKVTNYAQSVANCTTCGYAWVAGYKAESKVPKPAIPDYVKKAINAPSLPEGGLEAVKVHLIDEPFWEPGHKAFRNVEIRMRLHEDPLTLTTWREKLWAEFFEMLKNAKVLDSDQLLALSQKMFEIEEQRKKDETEEQEVPPMSGGLGTPGGDMMVLQSKDGTKIEVPKTTKASQVPEGSTPVPAMYEIKSVVGEGPFSAGDLVSMGWPDMKFPAIEALSFYINNEIFKSLVPDPPVKSVVLGPSWKCDVPEP